MCQRFRGVWSDSGGLSRVGFTNLGGLSNSQWVSEVGIGEENYSGLKFLFYKHHFD